ncbi:MAG TPA: ATP-binding cassette domain-containing protein [Microbacterium sp.]|nr:ATP-binding cassette domain-containing protein [Microbacterium sp.]
MPEGQVLEFTHVTKRFSEVTAVSDFSARIEPGVVTAFLGPNGAGKTTTLRMLLGQVRPTSGTATIGGTAYAELRQPLRTIGAVLEETPYRPRRTANRQLTIAAKANGIPLSRIDEVLALVGLDGEGDTRIGGYSLGMRQRLSVATALLGDPGALVFDEPANGLDPEGIRWMRLLMRRLADEGRTVLVSSHVLSEVEQVADQVLVLSKGQLVLASGIEELADPAAGSVVVDADDRAALTAALSAAGFEVEVLRSGLTVRGGAAPTVGAVAASAGIALRTLVQRGPTLEDVFIELVRGGKLEARAQVAASQLTPPRSAVAPRESEPAVDAVPGAAAIAASPAAATAGIADPVAAGVAAAGAAALMAEAAAADEAHARAGHADADHADAGHADAGHADVDGADADSEGAQAAADGGPADAAAGVDGEVEFGLAEGDSEAPTSATQSFDEILFGASPASSTAASPPVTDAEPSDADSDTEAPGIEIFADLGEGEAQEHPDDSSGVDAGAALTDGDADTAGTETTNDTDATASEDDPRSAGVSLMLAAAARAYFDDEPKDYPLSEDGGDSVADESAAPEPERAQWAVASTGVIDTVPLAAVNAAPADEGDHHEGEHNQGEHGDRHEHHEGGEHHEGDHHQGEHDDQHEHHEGGEHHHHEGEHHHG